MLAELYDCGPALADEAALIAAARAAVLAEGATIIGSAEARYVPHGLTVALFLAESHLVLTTWPEYRLLLIDVMLCNPAMSCRRIVERLRDTVGPGGRLVCREVPRIIAASPLATAS